MFRTKADVDRHVLAKSAKISDRERAARSYSFAQLYYGVEDYETCRRYVSNYLSAAENNAAAHTLLGNALIKLGHKEKALEEFKISYELDPSQKNLLITVCEILTDHEVFMDVNRAKYWHQLAETINPNHPAVFQLKERVMSTSGSDPESMEKLLEAEIKKRPDDVSLHARYLRQLLTSNKTNEAFTKSLQLELEKGENFRHNFVWYETLLDVLNYNKQQNVPSDWEHSLLRLIVVDKVCTLNLMDSATYHRKSMIECSSALQAFDQALFAAQHVRALPELVKEFSTYFKGQMCLHIAIYLLKKGKRELIIWRDAIKSAAPFLLMAFHARPPEEKPSWLSRVPDHVRPLLLRWSREASYRCSQAGHVLQACVKENRRQLFCDEIMQTCANSQWKHKVYDELFTNKDKSSQVKTSYLIQNLQNPDARLPRLHDLHSYDQNAQKMHPDSLHHFVWLGLNYNLVELHCNIFETLPHTVQNVSNCSPETLSQIDIDAFLYCTTITAQQKMLAHDNIDYKNNDKPSLLPADITDPLCTVTQRKWWECAYNLNIDRYLQDVADKRSILMRGIEVIRCIGNHGMSPTLLCTLAGIFSDRANTSKADKSSLDDRAFLYYAAALPLLEDAKFKTNNSNLSVKTKFFDYTTNDLTPHEIDNLLEEAKLFLGIRHMNEGENEKAVEMLKSVKSPYGSYHLFYIFKRLSDDQINFNKENITSEMRSKRITLLTKARQAAYATLDRIKGVTNPPKKHPLYADIHEQLQSIELKLCRLDPECDEKYSSDDDSSKGSSEHMGSSALPHVNSSLYVNASSTPKHRVRSELNSTIHRSIAMSNYSSKKAEQRLTSERLDYHIKQLQKKEELMVNFIDQTKDWLDENRGLSNDVREIKKTISDLKVINLQDTIDQFKTLKLSIEQVRDRMTEHRDESKSEVRVLRKEITELKKEISKVRKAPSVHDPNSDIYLDDLQNSMDQNQVFPNSATQLPFSQNHAALPGFPQRVGLPSVSLPPHPGSYNPFSLQNPLFLYNQYSQLAQLPQFYDTPRPSIFPGNTGLFPTDQLYPDVSHLLGPSNITAPIISQPPPVSVPIANIRPTPLQSVSQSQPEPAKSLPVNVVITSSDPLPTRVSVPQPTLSVTIPPEHIKGNIPHNYQITMPSETVKSSHNTMLSSVSTPKFGINTTMSGIPSLGTPKMSTPPVQSIYGTPSNLSGFFDTPKKDLSGTFLNADKSRTLSEESNVSVEYDPCPDFKPIIELPDEVEITTGEENEIILFKSRAKLLRFVDKQWKDRGIGDVKLLKNKATGKVRLLMRREQTYKICANHGIIADMELRPMKGHDKAYIWAANDFADEIIRRELFCIRFKTIDIGKNFYDVFEKSRQEEKSIIEKESSEKKIDAIVPSFGDKFKPKSGSWICNSCYINNDAGRTVCVACQTQMKSNSDVQKILSKPSVDAQKIFSNLENPTVGTPKEKQIFGGLTFSSTPTFKPMSILQSVEKAQTELPKVNPFASFTFSTTTQPPPVAATSQKSTVEQNLNVSASSDHVEDFVPTAEFKPAIPLPALVETKTGEEGEIVIFEHRAKLLRYDSTAKEWKERGLGIMKLLRNKDNNKLRLLMRREVIFKVCCNHIITKNMKFERLAKIDSGVTWCALDFSETEGENLTFCLRFKTGTTCNDFLNAIEKARADTLDKSDVPIVSHKKNDMDINKGGFGDQFKMKPGSWNCTTCLVNNNSSVTKCISCSSDRESKEGSKADSKPSIGFGDKFKPKLGEWSCSLCYVTNKDTESKCVACGGANPNANNALNNISLGDNYWTCLSCKTKNDNSKTVCILCSVTKGDTSKSTMTKFIFGITPSNAQTSVTTTTASSKATEHLNKYTFGKSQIATEPKSNNGNNTPFSWIVPNAGSVSDSKTADTKTPFSFTRSDEVQSNASSPWNAIQKISNAGLVTPTKKEDGSVSFTVNHTGKFGFQMKPKSPGKSPKSEREEDSGNEYASEDEGNHIHFTPVIPLPDKVEIITGEEDEEVLYTHRAKLYRFVDKEFKSRGIGDVKILKHKENKKLRVLMRRDQVFNICLNHALTKDIKYIHKDDKCWVFSAHDFSEGQLIPQQFCLQFKTKEIADDFMNHIDMARSDTTNAQKQIADLPAEEKTVNEVKPNPEDVEAARKLQLPDNFFDYKMKEKCLGCRGCTDDDFVFPKVDLEELETIYNSQIDKVEPSTESVKQELDKNNLSKTVISTPTKAVAFKHDDVMSNTSVFSTPNFKSKEPENEIFSTPQGSFGVTPNMKVSTNIFSIKNAELNSNLKDSESKPVFSPKASNFGNFSLTSQPIFGNNTKAFDELSASTKIAQNIDVKANSILTPPKLASMLPNSELIQPVKIFGQTLKGDVKPALTVNEKSTTKVNSKKSDVSAPRIGVFANDKENTDKEEKPFIKNVIGEAVDTGEINKPKESVFKSETTEEAEPIKSIFGWPVTPKPAAEIGNIFAQPKAEQVTKGGFGVSGDNIFSIPSAPSLGTGRTTIFGANSTLNGNLFSQKPISFVPSVKVVQNSTTDPASAKSEANTAPPQPKFSIDNNLTFDSLAAGANTANFSKSSNFTWEGAGQKLFSSNKNQSTKSKSKTGSDRESECEETKNQADDEHDPYFEPIVPLPDEIVVTTGEEDEEVLFSEKGKLYRYDIFTKQWKERGNGNMKLLHHKERNTYRLLLRWDQVHKLVLNQLVTHDFELLPMLNSNTAWMWVGRNHAESDKGEIEKLAIKFHNDQPFHMFKNVINEAVAVLASRKQDTSTLSESAVNTSAEEDNSYQPPTYGDPVAMPETSVEIAGEDYYIMQDEDDDHNHDEDNEDYEVDDSTVIFSIKCKVTYVNEDINLEDALIQMVFDPEVFMGKILIMDADGRMHTNMLIVPENDATISGASCEWLGLEGANLDDSTDQERTIRATFQNESDALDFYTHYMDCICVGDRDGPITDDYQQHNIGSEED